ncbi:carbohydrate ABC transporter permease [Microbacterium sp. NPDC087591]|uniref:carbohydrate ABC transporter permease n=1 Tax=Microbacterium sp. NPDC087591 TaxID=3364192 RepID=UPI00382947A9
MDDSTSAIVTPHRRERPASLPRREARVGIAFVAPTFIWLTVFVLGPSVAAIVLSFTEWFLVGTPKFVGAANYLALFEDSAFGQALIVTFQVAAGVALPGSVLALVLALLMSNVARGRAAYQAVFYLPLVIPSVVSSIIWGAMYLGQGVINTLLGTQIKWLADPVWALVSILMLMVWTNVGYYTILVFAGLQDIPAEILEAASMDGAGPLQRLVHIIVPLLRPVLLFVLVIATTEALTLFVQPYLLTQGGPGGATQTLSLYIYQVGFSFGNVGKASAMAVVLLVIAILFAIVQFRALRSSHDD